MSEAYKPYFVPWIPILKKADEMSKEIIGISGGVPDFHDQESDVKDAKMLDTQIGGDWYKDLAIQPIEFCQKNELNHCESSAIKYICRHRKRGGREDIEKAIDFLKKLLEMEYAT